LRGRDRPKASGQPGTPFGPGLGLGEVELVGTGLARGVEVGAVPFARRVATAGVESLGLGALALMVVVREEPSQVAQLGGRAGGPAQPPVARGAHCRAGGDASVAQPVNLDLP
jgi:hypothetical protein